MTIKIKTVHCTKKYELALEDKCEKCRNIFSWRRTIDISRSSDIEGIAKAKVELSNYELRNYVFNGQDDCHRKFFSHPVKCPRCKHKQEWIEKAIVMHKKSDSL